MFILKGVLQDTMGGLQDPLLSLHYISTIGRSIGSLYCLFIIYILKGVLLDPLGGLQDPLFSQHNISTIRRSIGSHVVC